MKEIALTTKDETGKSENKDVRNEARVHCVVRHPFSSEHDILAIEVWPKLSKIRSGYLQLTRCCSAPNGPLFTWQLTPGIYDRPTSFIGCRHTINFTNAHVQMPLYKELTPQ